MADAAATLPHPHVGGRPTAERPQMLAVGIMIWLGSEFMFFSGLFAAFFTIRANARVWPPPGTKLDTYQALAFTFVLLASSPTMQFAVWAQERGEFRKAKVWLVTSFLLGAAFLANQAYEWKTLPFRPRTNAYGSLFYIMSGLHGLHVLLGLVAMIALYGRLAGRKGDPGETTVFQGVSYYWHFVDIVWIGLFSALFLLS
ncbi:MAG TPA: heme-copper oxidase subunit III [Acidimicrobiales bacterium]|nr:heme-copper oxidase subunit III [Acidimicrobiales bacterium]